MTHVNADFDGRLAGEVKVELKIPGLPPLLLAVAFVLGLITGLLL